MLAARTLVFSLIAACTGAPLEPFDEAAQARPLVQAVSAEGRCPPIRALTFNAFSIVFHENHDEITRLGAAAVVAENADIVAIQEVWLSRDADVYAEALREAGLIHQIAHTSDAALARGSAGLLLASRFPIVEERFVPFRSAAAPYWMWPPDWYASKGILEVILETETGLVRVLNAHVHADYERGGYLRERLGQSMELAALMRERATLPLLVMGDMNSQPEEVSHAVLTRDTGAEVVARADVDLVLTRDGEHGRLQVEGARFALVHRVQLQSGAWSRLSDHAGLLASLEHCQSSASPTTSGANSAEVLEIRGVEELLREAIEAARLQSIVARWVCAALGVLLLMWLAFVLRRRRPLTSYEFTAPLFVVWIISWTVYQGWLAAPEQLAAYEALLP